MQIKEELRKILKNVVIKLNYDIDSSKVLVDEPPNSSFGDYATTLPLVLGKKYSKNPKEIGEEIKNNLSISFIHSIDVTSNGYLNFWLAKDFLENSIKKVLIDPRSYISTNFGEGRKALVEFVSANPTGPLTVANARGGPIGDTIANLLSINGYKVEREFYVNDAGAKILKLGSSVLYNYKILLNRDTAPPAELYPGEYIKEIAKKMIETYGNSLLDRAENEIIGEVSRFSLNKMLENMKEDLSLLNINFDNWFMEHTLHQGYIDETIEMLAKSGYIYKAEGAVWFKSTSLGDDKDRVLIRSDGTSTYLAGDIAYHRNKFERGFELLVDIWGADQSHINSLKLALKALGYDMGKLKAVTYQLVHLFREKEEIKMSKSSGEYITLRELIDEVGPDVARFIFLTRANDSHLNFDIDIARSRDPKNPVFYAQYAYTRCRGILREAEGQQKINLDDSYNSSLSCLQTKEEIALMRKIAKVPDYVFKAFSDYSPNLLTQTILSIADDFHNFYEKCRVIGAGDELEKSRLSIVMATEKILKELFNVIGIKAPERM